jgi:hypothetical protein
MYINTAWGCNTGLQEGIMTRIGYRGVKAMFRYQKAQFVDVV